MLILASLSGIQDFLFDVRESGGGQARSLRYRSFRIQLFAECVALRLLEAAGIPRDRLLFCAAAKLAIDASGLSDSAADAVRATAAEMAQWLLDETHGRLRLSVAVQPSPDGFASGLRQAEFALRRAKLRPFAPAGRGGSWRDGALVVRERRDSDEEADRDAGLGRGLINGRWLTIERAEASADGDALDALGLRVRLSRGQPMPSPSLLSCSNLDEPAVAPRGIDRGLFHERRLARHIPRDDRGDPTEFVNLARSARGARMLGVLKADADSLGAAVAAAAGTGNGRVSIKALSAALDSFFAETLEAEKRQVGSRWSNIYTVFSGGDDMLVAGPWDVILDFAGHMQRGFNQAFGRGAAGSPSPKPLTISAGVAIIKPKYPIHLAAWQADELLDLAKTTPAADAPKDQCAALGQLWKWKDHDAIISAGRQLADWVGSGVLRRGWLHTLLELALLRRGEGQRRSPKQDGNERLAPAMATARLAYHVARNWPCADASDPEARTAREWIDAILREFDQFDSTSHVETIYLPAIVRYAMLATRAAAEE